MMSSKNLGKVLALLATLPFAFSAQAASIYLSPTASSTPISAGTISLELFMDFTGGDPTVGGGIDVIYDAGFFSSIAFAPTTYFSDLDSSFTGHSGGGGVYEIHFGDFGGFGDDAPHKLGDLTFGLSGLGSSAITMGINATWGDFFSAVDSSPQPVDFTGATVEVTAVPVPAAVWLMGSGLAFLGTVLRKKQA